MNKLGSSSRDGLTIEDETAAAPMRPLRQDRIDVSSHDLERTVSKERRRQAEALKCDGLGELDHLLAPLAIAVARLTARVRIEGGC